MTELKGPNQIDTFRQVAQKLMSRISACEGVCGILYHGGLVRGVADRFSDIDITVFLDRDDKELQRVIRSIEREEEKRSGLETDMMICNLDDSRKGRWSEIERREFSKAKIVFDPEGQIEELLNDKLSVSGDFWVNRIITLTQHLKWYCCPYEQGGGTITEVWVERGDSVAAHHCVSYGLEVLFEMMFVLNREFFPSVKWRLFDSYALKWQPNNYRHLIQETMLVRSFSKEDLDRRLNAVRQLWNSILPKIEEQTRMTLKELDVYYVQNILHQNVSFPD